MRSRDVHVHLPALAPAARSVHPLISDILERITIGTACSADLGPSRPTASRPQAAAASAPKATRACSSWCGSCSRPGCWRCCRQPGRGARATTTCGSAWAPGSPSPAASAPAGSSRLLRRRGPRLAAAAPPAGGRAAPPRARSASGARCLGPCRPRRAASARPVPRG